MTEISVQFIAGERLRIAASIRRSTAFGWVLFESNTNLTPLGAECPSAVLSHQGLTAWITVTLPRREGEDRVIMELGNAREVQLDSDMRVEGPCAVLHRRAQGSRLIGRPIAPNAASS